MSVDFFKFPSTPHLATLSGVDVRDDKVLSERERYAFLSQQIVVEEKVDGANLGISFDSDANIRAQNRGAYLERPASGQWKKLDGWLARRTDVLFGCLADRYILFGEWCFAHHTVFYTRLPDWFLAFDVYDRDAARFLASARRDELLQKMSVAKVPRLGCGRYSLSELRNLLSQSKLTDGPAEGLYLRLEQDDWLEQRTKLVRPQFVQSITDHWSRSGIKPNRLNSAVHG